MQGTTLDTASSCYVGKIDFDAAAKGDTFHSLSDWVSFGNVGKIETCSAVSASAGSDLYVAGSVAKDGMFSDGQPMQGLLSILNTESLGFIDATLIKSAQDPTQHMIYPLDVYHDLGRSYIYIAALTSTDAEENKIFGNPNAPNWQEQHMLGSGFDVTVIKIHAPENAKPSAKWVQHFPLDDMADGTKPPIFLAGITIHLDTDGDQHLLVSGSTRGSGEAFGKTAPNSVDEDGFIMQLKLSDGSFIRNGKHIGKNFDYTKDLREGTASDDFIRGMCNKHARTMDHAVDHFYIVGGTKGDMTTNDQGVQNTDDNAGFQFSEDIENMYLQSWDRTESIMPFLRKVSIADLKPMWTTQWAAMPQATTGPQLPTNAFAMDCVVDNNEKSIYVVGSVMNEAKMAQGNIEMVNQGNDDIWVAKVDEETGNVFWLTQLGSLGQDRLGRRGSIAVSKDNAVYIYGDTNGSLYRPRQPVEDPAVTDMFIMSLDGITGAVMDNYYLGGTTSASITTDGTTGVAAPPVPNNPVQPKPPVEKTFDDDDAPAPEKSDHEESKSNANDKEKDTVTKKEKNNSSSGSGKAGLVVGIIAAVVAVSFAFYLFMQRRVQKQKAEAQKSSIFACLQQFDVEDIDLRRSPPGGWHGTYMNKLAYGHNNADDMAVDSPANGAEGAPLTHSSVASDALFMDADNAGGEGYRDDFQIDDEDVDVRIGDGEII